MPIIGLDPGRHTQIAQTTNRQVLHLVQRLPMALHNGPSRLMSTYKR